MHNKSGDFWRSEMAKWAIPKEILDQAPESPWIHPPAMFELPKVIEDSISHQRAREVIDTGGSILDIGCGGGIAAFAVTPPASHVIGVDHQNEMLEMFENNAKARSLTSQTHLGFWPAIAKDVEIADVAVAHHVMYNVQEVEDFLIEINSHAKKRVVLEIPQRHPLSAATPLWRHFWNLERPTGPTPKDLLAVLSELGIEANLELWDGQMRQETDLKMQAHYSRIRLCLPAEREGEVVEFLRAQPREQIRNLATIWWNVI